jgi:hypothetical protein
MTPVADTLRTPLPPAPMAPMRRTARFERAEPIASHTFAIPVVRPVPRRRPDACAERTW